MYSSYLSKSTSSSNINAKFYGTHHIFSISLHASIFSLSYTRLGIYCTGVVYIGCILRGGRYILHRDWIYVAPYIYIYIYTFYIYSFIHLLYKKQLFFLKLHVILYSVKYFYYILNKRRKVMYTTVSNDFILVERKILYNDSLNCREKIALIILLDTDNGNISYEHLAQKMGVTKPTAITTIKSLKEKGLLKCNLKQNRKENGRTITNQYFVTI